MFYFENHLSEFVWSEFPSLKLPEGNFKFYNFKVNFKKLYSSYLNSSFSGLKIQVKSKNQVAHLEIDEIH